MSGEVVTLKPRRSGKPARRPFVFINMSMTADGKIATANRRLASFGSRHDLEHLYALRATADAVMCGARTLEAGEVTLGTGGARHQRARLRRGLGASHLRVLVTGRATLDPAAPVFGRRFSPIIVLTTERASKSRREALRAVADEVVVCKGGEVDWAAVLGHLRQRWGVKRLLCEGGADLNDALFRAGLVDELHLTICPFVFGGRGAPTIAEGVGVSRLAEAARLRLKTRRRVGDELFCVFRRAGDDLDESGEVGRARFLPSRRPSRFDPARREARPTGFMVSAHGPAAKAGSREPKSGGEPPHSRRFAISAARPSRAQRLERVRFPGAFGFIATGQVRGRQAASHGTRPD